MAADNLEGISCGTIQQSCLILQSGDSDKKTDLYPPHMTFPHDDLPCDHLMRQKACPPDTPFSPLPDTTTRYSALSRTRGSPGLTDTRPTPGYNSQSLRHITPTDLVIVHVVTSPAVPHHTTPCRAVPCRAEPCRVSGSE